MTTLYLDMDGVVADFDEYALRTHSIPAMGGVYPPEIWEKIAQNKRIYRELKKTSYADMLVETCRELAQSKKWQLIFLTAVPKGNDVKWAFYDKMIWAQLLYPGIPVHFGPYSKDKYKHCSEGDILIDDRLSNINDWKNAGGVGIHHVNINTTMQEIAKLY